MFRNTSGLLRSGTNRGFTLIEILCVVVILGIASAVIIPQLGSRDDLQAAAAARVVISDLMYAQNMAISRQRRHYVQFVGQQYTVLSRNLDTDPLAAVTHPITKSPFSVAFGVANQGLQNCSIDSIDFGGPTILGFDDLGSPFTYDGVTATPITVPARVVVRSGGLTLTVSIEPFTGEASVQ